MRRMYYTEYPMSEFEATSDKEALNRTRAKVVYREADDTPDGTPFIVLRDKVKRKKREVLQDLPTLQ